MLLSCTLGVFFSFFFLFFFVLESDSFCMLLVDIVSILKQIPYIVVSSKLHFYDSNLYLFVISFKTIVLEKYIYIFLAYIVKKSPNCNKRSLKIGNNFKFHNNVYAMSLN